MSHLENEITFSISIPESLSLFVEQQVAANGCDNPSDYLRGLIQDERRRRAEEQLEALLMEGLKSGESIPVTTAYWREVQDEIQREIAARSPGD